MKISICFFWVIVAVASLMALVQVKADDTVLESLELKLNNACDAGDLEQVKALLAEGAPVDGGQGPYSVSPLISADKHADITKFLLDHGAKVDSMDAQGNTALIYAAFYGQTAVVQTLLEAGANPEVANSGGRRALMNAAKTGRTDIVKLLLAHHAEINAANNDGSAIWFALEKDNADALRALLEAGADLKTMPTPPLLNHALSLLGEAARNGYLDEIDLLIDHGISVDSAGEDGTTALMEAVYWKKNEAAAKLIARGANVNLQDKEGCTALYLELSHFDQLTFESILNAHADLNLADKQGETPLMRAIRFDQKDVWNELLQHGAKLEAKDREGHTPLIISCIQYYPPSVYFLVSKGADVNAVDKGGETALTHAGNRGEMEIVQFLKSHGATHTDFHIIPTSKPTPPLSRERAFALAVGAIYAQVNGKNPHVLGYGGNPEDTRPSLENQWGITDKASFQKESEDLLQTGQRTKIQAVGQSLSNLTDAENSTFSTFTQGPSAQAARRSYSKWKDRTGLAWDMCRYVNLINDGYAVGYISEPDAWDHLRAAADQVHAKFSSWQEMSDNFLDGREVWAGEKDPSFEECSDLLLNPKDPNSVWTENPWSQ